MKVNSLIKIFLFAMILIILLWKSYDNISQNSRDKSNSTLATPQLPVITRVVRHALGETKIPVNPQRIIVLHDTTLLDPVLSLGIKPIGTVSFSVKSGFLFRGVTNDEAAGIELVGTVEQPNLEKILMLKPDLILMREYQSSIYKQLSAIAPTVAIDLSSLNHSFKKNFRFIAQVLGENEKAEQVMAQYEERVKELQRRIGERIKKIEVSIIYYYGKNIIGTFNRHTSFNQVFNDVNLRLVPILAEQKEETLISTIEVLKNYDADVLFIINGAIDQPLSDLKNPIWSSLTAAKNKRIYEVKENRWWVYGFLGVNKLLDDLFKYLG